MRRIQNRAILAAMAALALFVAACSPKEPHLLNLRASQTSPDEFAILPGKPLEAPTDYASLPPPTPGGTNLTDPTPMEDAVTALGGRASALQAKGIPAADGVLVTYASRYGVSQTIRQDLAAEDLKWRRKNNGRPLERLFDVNVYFKAYRRMQLNKYLELERLRALGIRTPAVPPDPKLLR